MHLVLLVLFLVFCACIFVGPSIWFRSIMEQHNGERPEFPGTGADLARHLLDSLQLEHVKVEMASTQHGDHYDPRAKVVRLSPDNFNKKSLSGIVVAAHEVGHAIQDRDGDKRLKARQQLVVMAIWAQRAGVAISYLSPLTGALVSVRLIPLQIVFGILIMGVRVVADLVTLPVEYDASFNKALVILEAEKIISPEDMPAARKILTAAAWTYAAGSLRSLVDIFRWYRLFKGRP